MDFLRFRLILILSHYLPLSTICQADTTLVFIEPYSRCHAVCAISHAFTASLCTLYVPAAELFPAARAEERAQHASARHAFAALDMPFFRLRDVFANQTVGEQPSRQACRPAPAASIRRLRQFAAGFRCISPSRRRRLRTFQFFEA